MPRPWPALALAALLAGCGSSSDGGSGGGSGAALVQQSGCLSCHPLGSDGEKGPGTDLTHVGARLRAAKIRKKLLAPPSGMPSYTNLSKADLDALARHLARRR